MNDRGKLDYADVSAEQPYCEANHYCVQYYVDTERWCIFRNEEVNDSTGLLGDHLRQVNLPSHLSTARLHAIIERDMDELLQMARDPDYEYHYQSDGDDYFYDADEYRIDDEGYSSKHILELLNDVAATMVHPADANEHLRCVRHLTVDDEVRSALFRLYAGTTTVDVVLATIESRIIVNELD